MEDPSIADSEESAGSTVMAVPELVENVLLNLPLRDILLVQRVNKTWDIIIANSPRLQKALFFRSSEDTQLSLVETSGIERAPCKCRSDCLINHCTTGKKTEELRWGLGKDDEREYHVLINPVFLSMRNSESDVSYPSGYKFIVVEKSISEQPAYARPEASWRRMLFAQPPLKEVLVHHRAAIHWHTVEAKEGSRGLMLEDMHESADVFQGPLDMIFLQSCLKGMSATTSAEEVLARLAGKPAMEVEEGEGEEKEDVQHSK